MYLLLLINLYSAILVSIEFVIWDIKAIKSPVYMPLAVPVEKYLFIIFGAVGQNEGPSSDIRVIDMEKMSWVSFFEAPSSPSSDTTGTSSGSDSGSNTGTIVGAAVGSVAGVSIDLMDTLKYITWQQFLIFLYYNLHYRSLLLVLQLSFFYCGDADKLERDKWKKANLLHIDRNNHILINMLTIRHTILALLKRLKSLTRLILKAPK